jgi:hypothetical protein
MKFIISSISPGLLPSEDFDLKWHHISEDEFQVLAYDGYSCLRAKDIAKATGFAYNPEVIKTRPGDVLLLVEMYKGVMKFHCIQIVESEHPLLREEEIQGELI